MPRAHSVKTAINQHVNTRNDSSAVHADARWWESKLDSLRRSGFMWKGVRGFGVEHFGRLGKAAFWKLAYLGEEHPIWQSCRCVEIVVTYEARTSAKETSVAHLRCFHLLCFAMRLKLKFPDEAIGPSGRVSTTMILVNCCRLTG